MAFVPAQGYYPLYNPPIPCRSPIYGGLRAGMAVYINGMIPHHANTFAVNFSCGQYDGSDIALHFNPRFQGKDSVVFNSFQSGNWGGEENRKDGFAFRKGSPFEMVVLINPGGFQVNVNGAPFYEFRHRMPMERVECVHVTGDVTIQSITTVGGGALMGGGPSYQPGGAVTLPAYPSMSLPVMGGPMYNPPVPYLGNIHGGVTPKRTFVVKGFIPQGGQSFHINFKSTATNEIALHFNVRLNEGAVVRNSFLRGNWGNEERVANFNPFIPGQYFDISIRTGNGRYKVFVNGQQFCEYKHRFANLQMINALEIGGNIVLSLVQF
ncbi:PREDICTED: galectin-4-like [Nanorana parkeri]|uniref:galectin-4-like n=1 Tax=Nanorana parkeri TaxID=125878 RepID=UPI0008542AC3|nr:PREDICTED: galectin-4-like [Nanorana parkeri]